MAKIIRLTESDLSRIVRRVISEETSKGVQNDRAQFVKMMELYPKWKYNPNHYMSEFAFVPRQGDIGYEGFGNKEFSKLIGKPLIYNSENDSYCYLDKTGTNVVINNLGKKTKMVISNNIPQIKNFIQGL